MHVPFKIHYRNNLIDKKDSYPIPRQPSWDDRNYSCGHQLYPSEKWGASYSLRRNRMLRATNNWHTGFPNYFKKKHRVISHCIQKCIVYKKKLGSSDTNISACTIHISLKTSWWLRCWKKRTRGSGEPVSLTWHK
jgi:hypothetical protein